VRLRILPSENEDREVKDLDVTLTPSFSLTAGKMTLWKLRIVDKIVDELTEDLLNAAVKSDLVNSESWCATLAR
jgi:hypothetical protein